MISLDSGEFDIDGKFFRESAVKIQQHLKLKGDITIKFGHRDESKRLNKQYRNKDYPTDVLSFPIHEEFPESFYVGDILICHPVAAEQADSANLSVRKEIFTLICHGILHLAGYDHEKDGGEMLSLQNELIRDYYRE